MYDIFSFSILTHEDSLLFNFRLWVSKFDVIPNINFSDMLWYLRMALFENLIICLVQVNKEYHDIWGNFRKHEVEIIDGFPSHHANGLVVNFLSFQIIGFNINRSGHKFGYRQIRGNFSDNLWRVVDLIVEKSRVDLDNFGIKLNAIESSPSELRTTPIHLL